LYDTIRENYIRIVDELTKAQPQYNQSVSNLQLDYVSAVKNTIQNIVSAQKLLVNEKIPIVAAPYAEEFVKQSNEITKNTIRAIEINNQLSISALQAAAENYRTYNRTIDSVTEFTTTATKAWNSFINTQQQPFMHKQ
jgi:intracellular sulfur oxidation DsrE/DsrF family protein